MDDEYVSGEAFEFPKLHFLVLWDFLGESDSPWLEQKYVFFSEAAATEALRERREKRATKVASTSSRP